MAEEKKVKTINHLLNIEKFNGYHEGRLAPIVYLFLSLFIPAFFILNLYVWLARLTMNPALSIVILAVLYVLYGIRMGLIFLGNERMRVKLYRKRLYSRYEQLGEYVRIKNIHHKDGCIEFFDGMIAFMVIAYNGNQESFTKFGRIQKMFELIDNYPMEILVQNTADGTSLDQFYEKISQFEDKSVASDFLAILDYNKQYIKDKSLVVRTAFIFYGKQFDRRPLRDLINDSLPERAYYDIHIANRDEVLAVYSHMLQANLDIDELIMQRFATGQYYSAKVISYDEEDTIVINKNTQRGVNMRGFIPTVRR